MSLAIAATDAERELAEALEAARRERDDLRGADEHIAAAQQAIARHGVQAGADGSIVVGIERLAEERDDARAEVERLRAERNHAIVACRAMVDAERHRFDSKTYDEKYRSALRLLESVVERFDAVDAEEKP